MATQINVGLNFTADISQAQAAIQQLQSSLHKISYQGNFGGTGQQITKEMREAAEAAKQLQIHLNNAYNAKTGSYDLSRFNRSLVDSGHSVQSLGTKLVQAGATGQQAFAQLANQIAVSQQPMLRLNSMTKEFLTTLKNTVKWQISSTMIHGAVGAIQSANKYAKDLNSSLNNIRIVTGASVDEMSRFAEQANKAAKDLSTTTTKYTDAALIYFQQGLNEQEARARTDVTTKMSNVSRQQAEIVSDQLTAIWNNFYDGSKSLEYYADVITALGAATASSSDEISQGLEKFAAVAETVGLSYEYATASLATVTAETRQSADVVGNAYKTLFARIQGLKLGETLEDGTDLNKYSEALSKVGISIKDQAGEMKSMDNILNEMGAKWNNLNKDQQIALAQTVGGVRQWTQFVSLMDNWDKVLKNVDLALGSEGTLQKQADIYAESWEAARARVQASLETIYGSLLDDKFFIGLNNVFADIISGIGEFVKGIGGASGVVTAFSSIFLTNFAHKIPQALDNLKYNINLLFRGPESLSESYKKIATDMTAVVRNNPQSFQTESSRWGIESAAQLTAARTRLMDVSSRLTEKERQMAEQGLNVAAAAAQEIQALHKKNEALKESIELQQQSLRESDPGMTKVVEQRKGGQAERDVAIKKAQQQVDALIRQKQEQDAAKAAGTWDSSQVSVTARQIQQANSALADATRAAGSYKHQTDLAAEAAAQMSRNILDAYMKIKMGQEQAQPFKLTDGMEVHIASIDKITAAFSKSTSKSGQFHEAVGKAKQSIAELQQAIPKDILSSTGLDKVFESFARTKFTGIQQTKNALEAIKKALTEAEIPAEKLERVLRGLIGSDFDKLNGDINTYKRSITEAEKATEAFKRMLESVRPQHVVSGIEAMTAAAAGLGNVAMIINSLKSAFETLSNPDVGALEKFSSILFSVSMAVPLATSAIKNYGTVAAWLQIPTLGLVASLNKQSAALATNTAAAGTNAGANRILNLLSLKRSAALVLESAGIDHNKKITIEGTTTTLALAIAKKMSEGASFKAAVASIIDSKALDANTAAALRNITARVLLTSKILLIVAAVAAVTAALVYLSRSEERAIKANEEAAQKYEEEKNKVEELKNELQSLQDQIKELENSGPLDFVKQEELQRLKEREALLTKQLEIQERLAQIALGEQANEIAKNWGKIDRQNSVEEPVYTRAEAGSGGSGRLSVEQYKGRVGYEDTEEWRKANPEQARYILDWEQENRTKQEKYKTEQEQALLSDLSDYQAYIKAVQSGTITRTSAVNDIIASMQADLQDDRRKIYGDDYNKKVIEPAIKAGLAGKQLTAEDIENGKLGSLISPEFLERQGISQEEFDKYVSDTTKKIKTLGLELDGFSGDELLFFITNLKAILDSGLNGEPLLEFIRQLKNEAESGIPKPTTKEQDLNDRKVLAGKKLGDTVTPEDYNSLTDFSKQFFQEEYDGSYRFVGGPVTVDEEAYAGYEPYMQNFFTPQTNADGATSYYANPTTGEDVRNMQHGMAVGDYKNAIYGTQDAQSAVGEALGDGGMFEYIKSQGYTGGVNSDGSITYQDSAGNKRTISADVANRLAGADFLANLDSAVGSGLDFDVANQSFQGKDFGEIVDIFKAAGYTTNTGAQSNQATIKDLVSQYQNDMSNAITASDNLAKGSLSTAELKNYLGEGLISQNQYDSNFESAWMDEIEGMGLDVEDTMKYAENLIEVNGLLEEYGGNMEQARHAAMQMAKMHKQFDKGVESINKNMKDWAKTLKQQPKNAQALDAISDAVTDMLGATDELRAANIKLGDSFKDYVVNNLDKLEKAAKRDKKALNDLSKEAAKDFIKQMGKGTDAAGKLGEGFNSAVDSIVNKTQELKDMGISNIMAGQANDVRNELETLINDLGLGVEQANALAALMGWDVEFEQAEYQPPPSFGLKAGVHKIPDGLGGTLPVPWVAPYSTQSAPVKTGALKIKSGTNSGGGNVKKPSGGGGGGGNEKAPKMPEPKKEYEKERYVTVKNQLEDLEGYYDAISDAADRAFGSDKVSKIDQEVEALERLRAKQQQYVDEINGYLTPDREELVKAYKAILGDSAEVIFDEFGNVVNYRELQDAMWNDWNTKAKYIPEDSPIWEEYEKLWDDWEAWSDLYQETQDLAREETQKLTEILNDIFDAQLEKIQYKVEIKLNLVEADLAVIDFQLSRIEDNVFKGVDAITLLTSKSKELYDQLEINARGMRDLLYLSDVTAEDMERILSGDFSTIGNYDFTQDQIDALQEYRDNLLDVSETLIELREEVQDKLIEVFDEWNGRLDESIKKFETYNSLLNNFKNIVQIVGKDFLKISGSQIANIDQALVDNDINKLEASRAVYEGALKELRETQLAYDEALQTGNEETIRFWEETLRTIQQRVDEAQTNMGQAWEDALRSAAEAFSSAVELAIEDFEEKFVPDGRSLDEFVDLFDKQQKLSDQYVEDYKQIYELSKLNRDIQKSIDDLDLNNIRGKERLRDLQREINKLQEEGTEMSKYDLDFQRKLYELRLAEIALEEAQNAKDTVRLSRDNEGNYSYIYTQNKDKIDQLQQRYEDALYAIQELSNKYVDETSQRLIQTSQEMQQALAAVRVEDYASIEEYYKKLEEIQLYYMKVIQYNQEQLQSAMDNNKVIYEDDWKKYSDATGYKMSENDKFMMSYKDTVLGTLFNSEGDIVDFQQRINDALGNKDSGLLGDLTKAYLQWSINTQSAMNAAGTSVERFGNYMDKAISGDEGFIVKSEEAVQAVDKMAGEMVAGFTKITEAVKTWQEQVGNSVDDVVDKYLHVVEVYNDVVETLSGEKERKKKLEEEITKKEQEEIKAIEKQQDFDQKVWAYMINGGGSGSGDSSGKGKGNTVTKIITSYDELKELGYGDKIDKATYERRILSAENNQGATSLLVQFDDGTVGWKTVKNGLEILNKIGDSEAMKQGVSEGAAKARESALDEAEKFLSNPLGYIQANKSSSSSIEINEKYPIEVANWLSSQGITVTDILNKTGEELEKEYGEKLGEYSGQDIIDAYSGMYEKDKTGTKLSRAKLENSRYLLENNGVIKDALTDTSDIIEKQQSAYAKDYAEAASSLIRDMAHEKLENGNATSWNELNETIERLKNSAKTSITDEKERNDALEAIVQAARAIGRAQEIEAQKEREAAAKYYAQSYATLQTAVATAPGKTITIDLGGTNLTTKSTSWFSRGGGVNVANIDKKSFDTGGYTGEWGSDPRWALLHQKELVLNAEDTENLFDIIALTRDLVKTIDVNAAYTQSSLGSLVAQTVRTSNDQTLEQQVTITAEFPNVTNHSEIEEALTNLINTSSQYANRKNRA